jgi:uncharacterized protein (TIGR03435 family)
MSRSRKQSRLCYRMRLFVTHPALPLCIILLKALLPSMIPMWTRAVRRKFLALSQELGRPVIDKTDLKGRYDVMLRWVPEPVPSPVVTVQRDPATPPDAAGPSIFTSIQEQLGLKLESSKGSVEVLLIDSVHRPSEN